MYRGRDRKEREQKKRGLATEKNDAGGIKNIRWKEDKLLGKFFRKRGKKR